MASQETQDQFQSLVEEHKKILYKVSRLYCKNRDDRDDLAQEIVVQLWRSFEQYDSRRRFSTWMYRIALNVAISFYRRESTRNRHILAAGEFLLEVADETSGPADELALLYLFIEELDGLSKALLLLYLDGNSYQEIGEVLGIGESNVATKLNRLKTKMKQEFAKGDRQ